MRYHEGFLLQIIFYTALWLYDDYLGLIISLSFAAIFLGLLIFALIVEMVERSKVPKSYYYWMLISILPPLLVSLLFYLITGGDFDWLSQFG